VATVTLTKKLLFIYLRLQSPPKSNSLGNFDICGIVVNFSPNWQWLHRKIHVSVSFCHSMRYEPFIEWNWPEPISVN